MQGAHRSFRTLRGELRFWNHARRHYEAFQRQYGDHALEIGLVSTGEGSDEPIPVETEDRARIWLARPDRLREELTSGHGDRATVSTLVHVGATWWSYNPGSGAMTNDGDPGSQHGSRLQRALVDPAELLPWRELEIAGPAVHAGRPVIRVTSRPSPRDTFLPDVRGISGEWPEEYLVDAERGILLRIATFIDGEPFAVAEFTSVAFDEEIDEELFRFVLPPGEELRNARDGIDSDLGVMPLHEAAQAAPFGVYVPASVPDDWHMRVHFIVANERHGWPAGVSIHYVDAMSRVNVSVNEHDAGDGGLPETAPNGDAWRVEGLANGELRLWEPSDMERGMPRIGVIEIGGTRVQISTGDLGLEAIAELAAGLVPAPEEPPAVG
jgi:hypothetical protein